MLLFHRFFLSTPTATRYLSWSRLSIW